MAVQEHFLCGSAFFCGVPQVKSLTINGVQRRFAPEAMPRTLSDLLDTLDVAAATVVAEIDGAIVAPEQFGATELEDGQRIELIKFMGGG